jgi:hypothetical protein
MSLDASIEGAPWRECDTQVNAANVFTVRHNHPSPAVHALIDLILGAGRGDDSPTTR